MGEVAWERWVGKLTASTHSLVNPFRYTARESDTETGLYYYRARYYDQTAGRFLSEDPINFRAGVNFYLYAYNRPVNLRDPKGKDPVIGAIAGAVIGGIYGGLGAFADPEASAGDILAGAFTGAAGGGLIGFFDPSLGLGTVVAITAGGDFLGQVVTGHGWQKCKPYNFGSTIGAAAGGLLGGWGGGLLAGGGEGWLITGAKTALTGGPGVGLTAVGSILGHRSPPAGCGCE